MSVERERRREREGRWWWSVVVVVLTVCLTYVSVHIRPQDAPNWVAEHLGASSRRPRHPFPALMAGETPGRVPVYTALENKPVDESQLRSLHSVLHCLDHPRHLSKQRQA